MRRIFNKEKRKKNNMKKSTLSERLIDPEEEIVSPRREVEIEMTEPEALPKSALAKTPVSSHDEDGYGWDFIIMIPDPEYVKLQAPDGVVDVDPAFVPHNEIVERLIIAGLETYQYRTGDEDEIVVKVRAPLSKLKSHATSLKFIMKYDEHYLQDVIDDPNKPIVDDIEVTSYSPYEYIYGPYDQEKPKLFANGRYTTHPFYSVARIKLILDIIQSTEENCAALDLQSLINSKSVESYFPLHNDMYRTKIAKRWFPFHVTAWNQPIDELKDYFGEKTALYFEFLGHYTLWLVPLSMGGVVVIMSLAVQTALYGSLDEALLSGYAIPFYCIFVSFWAQFMIEFWKRKEATRSMEWGMTSFEEEEIQRPQYQGEMKASIIDGKMRKHFSSIRKFWRVVYSYFIISLMMLLVIVCVSLIFFAQYVVNNDVNDTDAQSAGNMAVSIMSAVQIQVLNMLYSGMAIDLTEKENHRTDTEYDDALIGKLFAFSFVNSYASLFFVAFIKYRVGEKCTGSCIGELAYQLAIIFGAKITVEKVSTFFNLYLTRYVKEREVNERYAAAEQKAREEGKEMPKKTEAEKQNELVEYDASLDTLYDYAQIFVQYGYVTLFVAACPVAPMLSYISNIIEFRADGWKLLYMTRRVIPSGVEDIGTWMSILQLTSNIAVLTNAGIICFTMNILSIDGVGVLWVFIGFQYFIFLAMNFFEVLIVDVPEEVDIQLKRQEYLVERASMSEEELLELNKKTVVSNSLTAAINPLSLRINSRNKSFRFQKKVHD